jgi:hypothetical protein
LRGAGNHFHSRSSFRLIVFKYASLPDRAGVLFSGDSLNQRWTAERDMFPIPGEMSSLHGVALLH